MLAAFTVAESCSIRPAVSGLLLLLVGIVAHDWRSPEYSGLAGFVSDSAIPVVIWLVGRVVRVQSHRADRAIGLIRSLEAEREVLAEAAAAQERLRLARELHDVVTHSLSVIVIQAQGAQRVLGDRPDQAADALSVIETAGRSTLTEMRRLLGLLRADEAHPRMPHPGLDDLAQLAKHVSAAGLPVTLTTQGEPRSLDGGLQLSAYRVVQEALTNSLKHARPATATVTLRWLDDALEVEVSDTGTRAHNGSSGGSGLVGMRERVAAHGGELVAGPGPDGGFRVSCRLPAAGPR
jgi:signal transduction histidine kinase